MTETELSPVDSRDELAAALAGFLDKWRARWPEWMVAEVFVPQPQRAVAAAWATLQQELTDAAWGGSDPIPGEAKLGWWQEELAGWVRGARRHPLGAVLQGQPAPWATLAAALPSLAHSRERPGDVAEAFSALDPFACAVAGIEAAMFADVAADDAAVDDATAVIGATLLQARLLLEGDAGVPLSIIARAGEADPRPLWAARLRDQWPVACGPRSRRISAALARARLSRPDPARPLPAWRALLVGWRAARG